MFGVLLNFKLELKDFNFQWKAKSTSNRNSTGSIRFQLMEFE